MRRKIYFTADWHVGHKKVMVFDERPFRDLDHMHEELVKNFNRYVPKHGVTYFLGDMGLCSNELLKSIITQLNGTKVLVRGNHDGGVYSMYNAGFDVVIEKAQLKVGKNILTLSHCPLHGVFRENTEGMRNSDGTENWHGENRHEHTHSFPDFGQFHVHGHCHTRGLKENGKLVVDDRQFDVGLMGNGYKPVSMSQIESWMEKHNKDKNE